MIRIGLLTTLVFFQAGFAHADDAKKGLEIATSAEKYNDGYLGETSEMKMLLVNAHGDKIERKMTSKVSETKNDGDKSIITFLWPADVKGTKMLTWTHKKEDDDQWLYLPSMKKVKRISSRSKTGSFMGSEFSYEDLGSQEVEKYKYKFVKDDELSGRKAWLIERYPNDEKSGYSKQLLWLDKQYYQPLKIEYFDRKKEKLKTALFSEFKKFGKKFWRAGKIEMKNHQTAKRSVLEWGNRKLGSKFSSMEFHKKNLTE